MRFCEPGVMEYQLEAEILHEFAMAGARHPAYNTIVGGGKNGCILHYIDNKDALRNGDLVLIDAGCELEYYAADITRTFPVNGRFTPAQRRLYELVVSAQQAAIDGIKPGSHWSLPHERSVAGRTRGRAAVGRLRGS